MRWKQNETVGTRASHERPTKPWGTISLGGDLWVASIINRLNRGNRLRWSPSSLDRGIEYQSSFGMRKSRNHTVDGLQCFYEANFCFYIIIFHLLKLLNSPFSIFSASLSFGNLVWFCDFNFVTSSISRFIGVWNFLFCRSSLSSCVKSDCEQGFILSGSLYLPFGQKYL